MSLTLQPEDPRLNGDQWSDTIEDDEFDDYDEDDDLI